MDVPQRLDGTGRPADFQFIDSRRSAQAEMHGAGTAGGIAGCGRDVVVLRLAGGGDANFSANAIAIAFGSLERDFQPVILTGAVVEPDFRGGGNRSDDEIELAVVIQIAEG